MKKIVFTFSMLALIAVQSFAQGSDRREEMEHDLELLSERMEGMFQELTDAIAEAKFFLENEIDLEKLDEKGNMRIMGDTVDITIFHNFIAESMEGMPERFRPSDDMLDDLRNSAEDLPDLLLRSKDFFNDEEFNKAFGDIFKEFNLDQIEPKAPTPRSENDEPLPERKPKKKKRKTVKI